MSQRCSYLGFDVSLNWAPSGDSDGEGQKVFERFLTFLRELPSGPRGDQSDDPRIAAAALLFHVMDADGIRQDVERERIKTVLADGAVVLERRRDGLLVYGDLVFHAGRVRYLLVNDDMKQLLVEVIDRLGPRTLTLCGDGQKEHYSGTALAELRAACLRRAA